MRQNKGKFCVYFGIVTRVPRISDNEYLSGSRKRTFSAILRIAFAFGSVVIMRSCSMRDMHIFFIIAW